MNNRMIRFLNSLNISNIERFDMDFDLVSKNQFNEQQIDMFIVKKTPWEFSLLDEFQNGLSTIGYPYSINFSYSQKPTAADAISLFEEWHRSHYRFQSTSKLEARNGSIYFIYFDKQSESAGEQVRKDFKDFLKFLNYHFSIKTDIIANDKHEDMNAKESNLNEKNSEVSKNEENSVNEIEKDILNEEKNKKELENEFIAELKTNYKNNKPERKFNKPFYERGNDSWRKEVEYVNIENLSDIDEETGNVDISGQLFDVEDNIKTNKFGKTTLNCGLGRFGQAVNVRFTENESITAQDIKSLKDHDYIRVAGYTTLDKFRGCVNVNVVQMKHLPEPEPRSDNEEQKRVELHLHTKMSAMDAVSTIEEYIKIATHMGHKAIAVTDHGVVQSFPEAQIASKDNSIKVIYGSELYVVNDQLPFALNPVDIRLKDATYVVFDLETTGLSSRYDRITEFGAVRFERGAVSKTIDMFINPEMPIPLKVQEKTKITNEMVKKAPTIENAIDKILDFFKDAIIVSHNITFDVGFINESLRRMGKDPLKNPAIDTLSLSRYLFPENNYHNLGTLSRSLGISSYNTEEAHRADYDANILNEVWLAMLNKMLDKNPDLMHSDLSKIASTNEMLRHMRPSHTTVLVKDYQGLKDLYELISLSHIDYMADLPKTPIRELEKRREHLLIGSACFNGDIFELERTRSKEDLKEAMKFFDYIEVQPPENYVFLINIGSVSDEDEIKKYIKDIVVCADELNIPVVATGDVHYANPEDKITRDIYIHSLAVGKKSHPLFIRSGNYEAPNQHYRSTREMLDAFEFLGKEKAFEIVVINTNKIADLVDSIKPIKTELNKPVIENSPQLLTDTCFNNAKALYGDPLPELIKNRLERELKGIIEHGYSVTYYIARELIRYANNDGHIVGSRGSVGSSFAAHMYGITEVNPLPPHYRCPNCKHLEFIEDKNILSGFDLPDKECPHCHTKMIGDGQNIPFETFLGFNAEKVPDIDLNFPQDYQAQAMENTKKIFGDKNVFRAGTIETVAKKTAFGYVRGYYEQNGIDPNEISPALIGYMADKARDVAKTTGQHAGGIIILPKGMSIYDFTPIQYPADDKESTWFTTHYAFKYVHDALLKVDILGHLDPLALRQLCSITGVNLKDIPLNDPKVLSLFSTDKALNRKGNYLKSTTGAIALPEYGTQTGQETLKETNPKTFSDLVIIAGLSHGTNVWNSNARDLILNKTCTLREVIGCRDDIMLYLIDKGLPNDISFKIMEDVRKGRKLKPEYEKIMRENKIPEWYINSCNKIEYMFPKAHAVAYATMAVRVAYFKVYYPLEFYAVWFTTRCKAFDVKSMVGGKDKMIARYEDIKKRKNSRTEVVSPKEEDIFNMLKVAIEMAERGFRFEIVDLKKSQAEEFVVDKENNALICPFVVIDGLGLAAAQTVVEARKNGEFSSQEDLLRRTKLNGTNVDDLVELGTLKGLGETDQMSIFEFGLDD